MGTSQKRLLLWQTTPHRKVTSRGAVQEKENAIPTSVFSVSSCSQSNTYGLVGGGQATGLRCSTARRTRLFSTLVCTDLRERSLILEVVADPATTARWSRTLAIRRHHSG